MSTKIPYEKYRLSNDMTVILHEDHALPVACVNLWYRVGAKDEEDGRTGFAHLFEHLMFMGTARVPEGEFDAQLESGGAWNNATTSEDRTSYYSFGPREILPLMLWLEADRLESLGRDIDQDRLDRQREVVRNERRQTGEMVPYGKAELSLPGILYPADHPYAHPVIGSHEDLEAAGVEDVRAFFNRYYVPCNTTLVVAGDFDPAEVKALIARLFGDLPRGETPPRRSAPTPTFEKELRVEFRDQVEHVRRQYIWHSPANFRTGDADLDLASDILGRGKSSRLWNRLVHRDNLALELACDQASSTLTSTFQIDVIVRPGVDPDEVDAAVDSIITELARQGPTEEELAETRVTAEVELLQELESLVSRADRLNEYDYSIGEPDGVDADLARYRGATIESVRDAVARWLPPERRLVVTIRPHEEGEGAAAKDGREARPVDFDSRPFRPPEPIEVKLDRDLPLSGWQLAASPFTRIVVVADPGSMMDPIAKDGSSFLLASMIDEGTGDLDAPSFARAIVRLGASIHCGVDPFRFQVGLSVLSRNLEPALDLFTRTLFEPAFLPKEWERTRRLVLESLEAEQEDAARLAARLGPKIWFGGAHPFGRPVGGTEETIRAIALDDLAQQHRLLVRAPRLRVFCASDRPVDEIRGIVEGALAKAPEGPGAGLPSTPVIPGAPRSGRRVAIIDKPRAVQTVIRMHMPGPTLSHPDRVACELLEIVLGGSFTSRLNANLREDKGWTYGIRALLAMEATCGWHVISTSVQSEVTGGAIREIFAEIDALRQGDVDEEEAEKARRQRRTDLIESVQNARSILATANHLARHGRPFSWIGDEYERVAACGAARLNETAREVLPLEDAFLLLVGDEKVIRAALRESGVEFGDPEIWSKDGRRLS